MGVLGSGPAQSDCEPFPLTARTFEQSCVGAENDSNTLDLINTQTK